MMASIPTKLPVPSENYDDLRFNAGKLDEFVTSSSDEYTDRLGITHLTARGLQNSVSGALLPENNLSDVNNKDSALSNLGGGTTGIAVFKGISAEAVRATLSAAASGNNTDILSITGSAAKITTARTLQVNLSSSTPASFDGSSNVSLGVTGTLARANGGTGQSDVSYLRAESTTVTSLAPTAFTKLAPTSVTDTKVAYSSGSWTCPATGYYQISGMVRFAGTGTGNIKAMLKIDSATSPSVSYTPGQTVGVYFNADSGSGEAILNLNCSLFISQGTSYSLYAYHSHTAALSTSQQALQIIRVA